MSSFQKFACQNSESISYFPLLLFAVLFHKHGTSLMPQSKLAITDHSATCSVLEQEFA
jgi:hypothetical protein